MPLFKENSRTVEHFAWAESNIVSTAAPWEKSPGHSFWSSLCLRPWERDSQAVLDGTGSWVSPPWVLPSQGHRNTAAFQGGQIPESHSGKRNPTQPISSEPSNLPSRGVCSTPPIRSHIAGVVQGSLCFTTRAESAVYGNAFIHAYEGS